MMLWHDFYGSDYSTEAELSSELRIDDMKTEYHPGSGFEPKMECFEKFGEREAVDPSSIYLKDSARPPWHPFETLTDFEFA